MPVKCFCCDFNWSMTDGVNPSAAYDWAFVDPQQYFDWHRDLGNNVAFCQAYAFGTPPDFRPASSFERRLKIVRAAFKEMP